jgi:dolichol-phosphate mannosyltransferase
MANDHLPVLAVLCPVYNEETVIALFFERMRPVITALSSRMTVKLVFLNNASTDRTLAEIDALKKFWPAIYTVSMSRNVGYQASLETGLRHVAADLYAVIDVDCEDPPEMIATFVAKYDEGFDIAYGQRVDRPEPVPVKSARKVFYRLLRRIADDDIILDMAEFSLFTREVRDAIIDDRSSFPFLRASIGRVGFRRIAIPFTRERRIAGTTHYNLIGMTVFAVAGLLSASTLPLRLPIYLLPLWLLALGAVGAGAVATHSAWLVLFDFMIFAVYVGATLASIALYVARAYKNGLQRPSAIIDSKRSDLPPPGAMS